MSDVSSDPLVAALAQLADRPQAEISAATAAVATRRPRRRNAVLTAATLTVGVAIGAAAAPGPAPVVAASATTIELLVPPQAGPTTAPDDALAPDSLTAGDGLADVPDDFAPSTEAPADDPDGTADSTPPQAPAPAAPEPAAPAPTAVAPPAVTAPPAATVPGPVWIITTGATDLNAAVASRPALASLAAGGVQLQSYTPLRDSALANGVALLSGKAPGEAFATADTLVGQLSGRGGTWKAYVEDLGTACNPIASGDYDPQNNPFVHFTSIADCATQDVDLVPTLDDDLAGTIPSLSWIVPDKVSDGTGPSGAAALETFLTATVAKITATTAYKDNGLILIVPGGQAVPDEATGALALSPSLTPAVDPLTYGPYTLLRGLEDRFGLGPLAHAGEPASSPTPVPLH
ncbi:MAG TPA: hypothetical protein VNT22_11405 [Baekduia sp.]|nr:hypothetical protein [Baekduia sp.]